MARSASRGMVVGKQRRKSQAVDLDQLEILNMDVAGIDIGSEMHHVSVPDDRCSEPIREFGCFTSDIEALATWLGECRIRSVVMEATGVYWVSTYRILRDHGFEVLLVDAYRVRNVPGRKTDRKDCRWLRRLHMHGLLTGCFLPSAEIEVVRTYWRHRSSLVEGCTEQLNLMHKSLEQMNVQLHKAISDVGGLTGMRIIRAILRGERDPQVLASLRDERIKCTEETLIKALTGDYREEHLFTLGQAVAMYDFLHHQMEECDERMRRCLSELAGKEEAPPSDTRTSLPSGRNAPHFDVQAELRRIVGTDLTRIEGISIQTAMTIFAELGGDVSAFPTEGHFASWLGLCPNHRITGGKVKGRRTRNVRSRLAAAFRVAAYSLHHSDSAMGAFYRRMRGRLGAPKAITATAHKLACMVYRILKYGLEYFKRGAEEYERQFRERQLKYLSRQARAFGLKLIVAGTGEVLA